MEEFCDFDCELHASDVICNNYTDLVRLINQEEFCFSIHKNNRCSLTLALKSLFTRLPHLLCGFTIESVFDLNLIKVFLRILSLYRVE